MMLLRDLINYYGVCVPCINFTSIARMFCCNKQLERKEREERERERERDTTQA